jgi:hypothetical protein
MDDALIKAGHHLVHISVPLANPFWVCLRRTHHRAVYLLLAEWMPGYDSATGMPLKIYSISWKRAGCFPVPLFQTKLVFMSHPQPSFKRLAKWSLLLLGCLCCGYFSSGQCTGVELFPTKPLTASNFNDTITVSTVSNAGDFYRVNGLALNRSYVFTSSNPADYITIRNVYTSAVLGHGPGALHL